MKPDKFALSLLSLITFLHAQSQLMEVKEKFTKADTLRGTVTNYRKGWDVLKYELTVKPDFASKAITGKNIITFYEELPVKTMQIDLQQPLIIDSIIGDGHILYNFKRDSNVCFVYLRDSSGKYDFVEGIRKLIVYYHGIPKEAKKAPWDGGLVWKTDSTGSPWIATACQGLGASVWYPCKDHQSDEPDSGAVIHLVVPDTLQAISNGRLKRTSPLHNGLAEWTWEVKNPINNYDITMNIGKYAHFNDTMMGEDGKLDLEYWVLQYNLSRAKKQFEQVKPMLHSHEFWFGKYPFYEDSYKLIETPFLGMEHQSGVAYGNKYQNGYLGRDLSGTGIGTKWDFIIVHESGHEWFGNNITTNDLADMWVHEGFTNYSEVLYIDNVFGVEEGNAYCRGIRKNIRNDKPIIGPYGVSKEGSSDMYYKAANMIDLIRTTINDDSKFRNILRGLNSTFFHKTVDSRQIENYISTNSGIDFSKVFDQYLRTIDVPVLEYYTTKKKLYYRWSNCIKDFDLPLFVKINNDSKILKPAAKWRNVPISSFDTITLAEYLENKYYIRTKHLKTRP